MLGSIVWIDQIETSSYRRDVLFRDVHQCSRAIHSSFSSSSSVGESPLSSSCSSGSNRGYTSQSEGVRDEDAAYIASLVKKSFERKPKETAASILDTISEIDRIHLLLAMQCKASKANMEIRDRDYVDDLVKSIRNSGNAEHHLSRGEIANALAYQRMLQRYSSHSHNPPSWKQLSGVMLASGLPFVGFGFFDNAIMLLSGDVIDTMIGHHLGITTLASAGLGNIAADVVGVSVTQQIKEKSRKISWAQPPRLSTIQQAMRSVRAAKIAGAACGVSVGCLLGMFPLCFTSPGFFVQ